MTLNVAVQLSLDGTWVRAVCAALNMAITQLLIRELVGQAAVQFAVQHADTAELGLAKLRLAIGSQFPASLAIKGAVRGSTFEFVNVNQFAAKGNMAAASLLEAKNVAKASIKGLLRGSTVAARVNAGQDGHFPGDERWTAGVLGKIGRYDRNNGGTAFGVMADAYAKLKKITLPFADGDFRILIV